IFDTEPGKEAGHQTGVPASAVFDLTPGGLNGTRLEQGTQLGETTTSLLGREFAGLDRAFGRAALLMAAAQNCPPLSFDSVTARWAIGEQNGNHAVGEGLTANGFVEVTLDGDLHSSDPTSRSFDRALAGATRATVSGIRYNGSGQDTLTLGSQKVISGGLTIQATGATVVTQDVAASGPLAIQASDVTVSGALR